MPVQLKTHLSFALPGVVLSLICSTLLVSCDAKQPESNTTSASAADTVIVTCVNSAHDTATYVAKAGSFYLEGSFFRFRDPVSNHKRYIVNTSCTWQDK